VSMIKENNPFFSIIIPIYNVSRFIDLGISEILNQSYKDFEIILVDDGSTDSSGDQCDKLASCYENISCYHQGNLGAGPARNLGINKSRGEYIAFFDIDDKVESNLLQVCHDELCAYGKPDVFMFSYDSYDVRYKTITSLVFERLVCSSNNEIRDNYVDHLLGLNKDNGFVWNKVYKRQFLVENDIVLPDLLIQQDEVFNLKVYRKAQTLVVSPDILYHYYVYDKGNTRTRYIDNRLNIYKTVKNEFMSLYFDWHLEDKRMLEYVYGRFFRSIIETLNFNNIHIGSPLNKNERLNELQSIINDGEVQDCIIKMESLGIIPHWGFRKWYFEAIRDSDVVKYLFVRKLDLWLRALKNLIKRV